MSIFFDTLICERCTLEKEKDLTRALKKVLCFMKKSMTRKEKDEEIFFLFTENGRLKIISEDGKSRAYFHESIKIADFCAKCEDVYFDSNGTCEFCMQYIVQIKDGVEEDELLLASPEAMLWEAIEEYYGVRFEVKK